MDESRRLSDGSLLTFEKIYPLDAVFDTYDAMPEELRTSKRYTYRFRDEQARSASLTGSPAAETALSPWSTATASGAARSALTAASPVSTSSRA